MSKLQQITVRRYLRTVVATAGTVLLSVLVTLAVMRELTPPRAAAQPQQEGEVRASAFVLVRADGVEIARLQPGGSGGGFFSLFDADGKERFALTPLGFLINNADGVTPRMGMGLNPLSGAPGINLRDGAGNLRITFGINPDRETPFIQLRDTDGMTGRVGMAVLEGRSWVSVNDADGAQRVRIGQGSGDIGRPLRGDRTRHGRAAHRHPALISAAPPCA
jgi:hypothetical protein